MATTWESIEEREQRVRGTRTSSAMARSFEALYTEILRCNVECVSRQLRIFLAWAKVKFSGDTPSRSGFRQNAD